MENNQILYVDLLPFYKNVLLEETIKSVLVVRIKFWIFI